MNRKLFGALAAGIITLSASAADNFTYKLAVNGADDGTVVYLMDFDRDVKVDSALVKDAQVAFIGTVDTPFIGRTVSSEGRGPIVIIEKGDITAYDGYPQGTPLNNLLTDFYGKMNGFRSEYSNAATDEARADVAARAETYTDSIMNANLSNPLGLYLFLQQAYEMTPEELSAALAEHPNLASSQRIQKVADTFARKEATSAGKMFTDFTVTDENGVTERLSDYVGKGKPVLVDFWASWCGPCRRESVVLKEIYNKYHDKGLEVLGVAVWDEPENSREAAEQLGLPWHNIINAQTIPTDLYGILGIPCIIMFDANGTILFRDLQGDDLKAAVDAAMTK